MYLKLKYQGVECQGQNFTLLLSFSFAKCINYLTPPYISLNQDVQGTILNILFPGVVGVWFSMNYICVIYSNINSLSSWAR